MAQAQTLRFSGFRVLLGDGAEPEAFVAPCGFTERSLSLSKELGSTNVPDCTNEDAAPWTERDVTAKSGEISGQGVLDAASMPKWLAFFNDDESKNVRVEAWRLGAKIGHWSGKFHCETLEFGATQGERVTLETALQSDGALVWMPEPPVGG